ncbi:MAG: glycosyltransferase family 2 protein [Saprospiraceae bacterium]|nr:glycosyltransferase family 2 protein [Candidatus Defluviibacterium haderslevense]
MSKISVIIPIYNEETNIQVLYERLKKVLNGIELEHELLFVNDGSQDQSIQVIKQLAELDIHVRYIDFSRNFGHQIAVTAGIDAVHSEYVVIIDADLQDPPELIPEMYAKMKQGFEVVYARRRSRKGEHFLKKVTAKLFYRILTSITHISIPLDTGDFRIMHKKVVDVLKTMPEQDKFLRGQISWIGFNQTFVEYDRDERLSGTTGYTYSKMIKFALDGITSFSNFPLKVASYLGFVVSFFSFLLILYALYSRLVSKHFVPGWASIMICVLFLGGVQLISIGIIGEYISRMGNNIRKRPLYIVKDQN